jgi:hypothetical protein
VAHQLKFVINKYIDRKYEEIQYIGMATLYMDGTGVCLANIGGMLCRVEIRWK